MSAGAAWVEAGASEGRGRGASRLSALLTISSGILPLFSAAHCVSCCFFDTCALFAVHRETDSKEADEPPSLPPKERARKKASKKARHAPHVVRFAGRPVLRCCAPSARGLNKHERGKWNPCARGDWFEDLLKLKPAPFSRVKAVAKIGGTGDKKGD